MSRTIPGILLVLCLGARFCCLSLGQAADPLAKPEKKAPEATVDFNRDIRPILSNHCYACHGPDEGKRKAGLRLDQKEVAYKALQSGMVALVPGKPEESELVRRITATSETERMPLKKFGKPLSKAQIDLLRKWVEQGAEYKDHWAYLPVQRPSLPEVKNKAWARNGIDHLILARLEKEGLKPSPEADRTTLIRRVTFDLTGLPPTPEEVDAFLTDASPNAYEKLVDGLLASPHYGERMAQHWLDLARFADTNGYHIDNHRDMWKWRDWVIDAFNKNMPFDQFTIEQLAGDLLPNATLEQRIASGFNRNCMVNFEGGADPNEYHTKYVIDRVVTTSTVWLSTTLACAECHDHKYDPFTQKEFYQLYAFFNNVPEKGLDGQKDNPAPSIKVATLEQEAQLAEVRKKLADLDARIKAELAQIKVEESSGGWSAWLGPNGWMAWLSDSRPLQPQDYVWIDDGLPPGAVAQGNEGPNSWKFVSTNRPVLSGAKSHTRTAMGLSQHFFTGANPGLKIGEGDKLFTYVYLDPVNPPKTIMLQFNDGAWEHRAYWGEDAIPWGTNNTASRLPMGPLPEAGKWVRLEVEAKVVDLKAGAVLNGWAFTQVDGAVFWDKAGIHTRTPQATPTTFTSQAEWEKWEKSNKNSTLPKPIQDLLKMEPAKRNDNQTKQLRDYFVQHIYAKSRDLFDPLNREIDGLKKAEADLNNAIPATMVMQEMDKPRDTFVLIRGDFQQKGEKVSPNVPKSLPPLPDGMKADRLALAKWLVAPNHPLTSRVTVNRYWEQVFGNGIVKTGEDFGSQGEWPSHPELLDWLASEFMSPSQPSPLGGEGRVSGWDVKAFMKMLVTSAAYRQSAKVTRELVQRDPENRLLARGPRFRLNAEMIRDNALAASGLLSKRLGGPSVRPYQPPGLWEQVAFGGGFSAQSYVQSKGDDLYRRGLYIYIKRSLPYPSLFTFDAPNREVCTDRRPRTNTPLQALVLLNDPVYVECARNLGQRVLKEGGSDTESRLKYAFKLCTAREPRPEELKVLLRIYEQQLAKYRENPKAAEKLVSIGESPRPKDVDVSELAAWTAIGNVLLNLDETVTKG